MKIRPITTLFLIESLDGKISTGSTDNLDVDKDFKRIHGVKEGLQQYYDIEGTTDPYSFNTGRVMAKIGVNNNEHEPTKIGCSFVIVDNKPHLTSKGVEYLAKWVNTLFLVTTNRSHPAFSLQKKHKNIVVLQYNELDLGQLLKDLKSKYGVERLTIQSGGSLNARWIREEYIDHVSVVIAPCLVGGKDTSTLMDGISLTREQDLKQIKTLKLVTCKTLKDSYIHITYDVINSTTIDPETSSG